MVVILSLMTDMEKGFNTGLLSAFGIKCRNLMGIAVFNETGTNLDLLGASSYILFAQRGEPKLLLSLLCTFLSPSISFNVSKFVYYYDCGSRYIAGTWAEAENRVTYRYVLHRPRERMGSLTRVELCV